MSNEIEDDIYCDEREVPEEEEGEEDEEKIIDTKRKEKKKVMEVDEKKLFHEFKAYALQVWYISLFQVTSQKM